MPRAYYNEIDPHAAAWIRELISAGHVAPGEVDERSIEDVHPSDLDGFTQCHFFAGIAVWSYALRKAGWPDSRPIWTGSCPCQPFSAAGKGAAFDDERHLWPAFHHLIKERRPVAVLGEQVASKDADSWVDLVQDDMEGLGCAFGAVPFPAASIGSPHIRDRMYWVAQSGVTQGDTCGKGLERHAGNGCATGRKGSRGSASANGVFGSVADAQRSCDRSQEQAANHGGLADNQLQQRPHGKPGFSDANDAAGRLEGSAASAGLRGDSRMGDAKRGGRYDGRGLHRRCDEKGSGNEAAIRGELRDETEGTGFADRPGPTNGFWRAADWLGCRDGKFRPVEPSTFPLVAGATKGMVPSSDTSLPIDANKTGEARVMRLRGYGNAINAVQAQIFIEVFMETAP